MEEDIEETADKPRGERGIALSVGPLSGGIVTLTGESPAALRAESRDGEHQLIF